MGSTNNIQAITNEATEGDSKAEFIQTQAA